MATAPEGWPRSHTCAREVPDRQAEPIVLTALVPILFRAPRASLPVFPADTPRLAQHGTGRRGVRSRTQGAAWRGDCPPSDLRAQGTCAGRSRPRENPARAASPAHRLGRQKLCACGGRKHRSPEAGAASRSSRGRGGPRPGPGGQGALPRPRRGVRARTEGSAPAALRRGDLREHRPAAASRPLCVWTPFDIGPAPHGVSEFRLRRNASGKSLCVRRLRWETRRVRSAGPAATSGPVLVLVRPELSSVLPDVSRIPRPSVRRRRELHTCGNHSVSVLATGLHHRAPSSSVRTCRSGSEWPSWLGLKPPRPPWQGAPSSGGRGGLRPAALPPSHSRALRPGSAGLGDGQATGDQRRSAPRPPPGAPVCVARPLLSSSFSSFLLAEPAGGQRPSLDRRHGQGDVRSHGRLCRPALSRGREGPLGSCVPGVGASSSQLCPELPLTASPDCRPRMSEPEGKTEGLRGFD